MSDDRMRDQERAAEDRGRPLGEARDTAREWPEAMSPTQQRALEETREMPRKVGEAQRTENVRHVLDTLAEAIGAQTAASKKPMHVVLFETFSKEAARTYADIGAWWRFRIASPTDLIIQALCAAGFVIWWMALPPVRVAHLSLVSNAFAADTTAPQFDAKPFVYVAIFIALLTSFAVSIYVQYFGRTDKAQDSAATVSKLLLGFFVGAGTKYLGT